MRNAAGLLVLFALAVGPASARILTIKTAAQEEASPRYNVALKKDGRQTVTGLCIDILRAIERVDPEIRFVGDQAPLPLVRVQASLEHGDIDAYCGLNKNPEREKTILFLEPPLYEVNYTVAVRADDDVQVKSFEDIRKLGADGKVLVMHGSSSQRFLENIGGLQLDTGGKNQFDNLQKLIAGRARFFYRHDLGLHGEIVDEGLGDKVKLLPISLDRQYQYLLVSKKAPPEVAQRLRKAIEKLKADGELGRIRARY